AELGLEEAFAEAISLIEWPDRLGTSLPPKALRLCFSITSARARQVRIEAGGGWERRLGGGGTGGVAGEGEERPSLAAAGGGGARGGGEPSAAPLPGTPRSAGMSAFVAVT